MTLPVRWCILDGKPFPLTTEAQITAAQEEMRILGQDKAKVFEAFHKVPQFGTIYHVGTIYSDVNGVVIERDLHGT